MRKIYLIVNNLVLNNIDYLNDETMDDKRVKRPLSIQGENFAQKISKISELENVTSIYSSGFASALGTAKYLSDKLNVTINIENKFNERKVGQTNKQTNFQYFRENQEHDFNYKLPNGESFNMTKDRVTKAFKEMTKINQDEEIAIFTHSIVVNSLLTNWCEVAYNLDNNLILNFNDKVVDSISGNFVLCLTFDDKLNLIEINGLN
ncbi:MAG: histidine phosphatase family protein [Bacilli bacterium]|nr:histidine phosphatase family protein [Bacilli bacterium]